MPGCEKQVNCTILMKGVDIDTKEEQAYHLPIKFYEADIGVEGILCYDWLATYDLVIRPFKTCFQKVDIRTKAWVIFVGLRTTPVEVSSVTRWDTPFVTATKPARPGKKKDRKSGIPRAPRFRLMMDLFSGTGSVGKAFMDIGYEVITVDFDGRRKPSIVADVTIWQYWKAFPPRYFDVVACCPPCTEFSRAMTSRPRDLPKADKAVKTALDIVDYLQPTLWFLENPRTGVLKDREYMQGIPYVDLDYCMFSTWGYQKPTRIWGSPALKNVSHVECNLTCHGMQMGDGPTGKNLELPPTRVE